MKNTIINSAAAAAVSSFVECLRCEGLENPLGMDEAKPRLSWKLADARRGARQTAYRVLPVSLSCQPINLQRRRIMHQESVKNKAEEIGSSCTSYRGHTLSNKFVTLVLSLLSALSVFSAYSAENLESLSISTYGLKSPAVVDKAKNSVRLTAPWDKFVLESGSPMVKVKMTIAVLPPTMMNDVDIQIDNDNRLIWQSAFTRKGAKSAELELVFEPSRTMTFSFFSDNYKQEVDFSMDACEFTLANGTRIPLASAFVSGYEKKKPASIYGSTFPEPKTESLTAAQSELEIRKDHLLQLGTRLPISACEDELKRTERILLRLPESVRPQFQRDTAALKKKITDINEKDAFDFYLEIRRLKRKLMLGDPAINFSSILCIDNPYVLDEHETGSRNGGSAVPGGRLLKLDGLGPDARVTKLAPNDGKRASFWRPDISYDANNVLFSMKSENEPAYHLYEIGIDGQNFRQLTKGVYDDNDPIYVPDGGIVFCTTRANNFLRCSGHWHRNSILARCDRNGKNIYFISSNLEVDHAPTVLPDGRLLFGRWEYVNRQIFNIQGLWTVNPDGTSLNTVWGNQSRWPDLLHHGHAIPNKNLILFNTVGHHHVYAGAVGLIDPNEGLNYPDGIYNLTAGVDWPEIGAGPKDKPYQTDFQPPLCHGSYLTPFPISENLMLISARKGRFNIIRGRGPEPGWFDLYLMDYDGNMELLYRGAYNVLFAQPIRPRERPHVIPSPVKWPGKMLSPDQQAEPGVFYCADIYEGSDIPRGMIKSLRVFEIENNTFSLGNEGQRRGEIENGFYGELGFEVGIQTGDTPMSLVYDEGPKRILGTVPVEEDGSYHFKAPPVVALFFQALDKDGRCLHTMRSSVHVMPGERRGCVGCHETRFVAPPLSSTGLAIKRQASEISPPPWKDSTISFPRFVQPVLNKNCISCHNAEKKSGDFDFTEQHGNKRNGQASLFSMPYVHLVYGKPPVNIRNVAEKSIAGTLFPYSTYPNTNYAIPTRDTVVPPMTAMSFKSKLVDIATSGKHHDVNVSPVEAQQLIAWVDAFCPYFGLEEMIAQPDPEGVKHSQCPPRMRTAPMVHRAFCQDGFDSQLDRLPKDKDGNVLPSVRFEDNRRIYQIPAKQE